MPCGSCPARLAQRRRSPDHRPWAVSRSGCRAWCLGLNGSFDRFECPLPAPPNAGKVDCSSSSDSTERLLIDAQLPCTCERPVYVVDPSVITGDRAAVPDPQPPFAPSGVQPRVSESTSHPERPPQDGTSAITVDRLIRKLAFADDRLPLGDVPLRTRCGLSDCSIAAAQDRPENRRPVRGAPVGQVIGVAFRILALRATARGLRTAPRSVATEPPHR
jgi:hypothetical protein